jgi:hypothetical protein
MSLWVLPSIHIQGIVCTVASWHPRVAEVQKYTKPNKHKKEQIEKTAHEDL